MDLINIFKNIKTNILFVYGLTSNIDLDNFEKEYSCIHFYPSNFLKKKKIKEQINKIKTYTNIFDLKEKIIIIHEIQDMNNNFNSILKSSLIKTNIKVLMIGSGSCIKKIKDLQKNIDIHEIEALNVKKILNQKLKKLNIKMELKLKKYIIQVINNDINIMDDILNILIKKPSKKYLLNDYKNIIDIFFNDINDNTELFDFTNDIFTQKYDLEDFLNLYNLEKIFLPLTIHYNYSKYIDNNDISNDKKLEIYDNISNMLSKSDNIHNYIYSKHCWNLNDNYGIISSFYPSIILNNNKNNKINLDFTNVISRESYNIINNNKYNKIKQKINLMEYDYLIIKSVCEKIILLLSDVKNKDNIKLGFDEMKKLNIDIGDLNNILKISKMFYIKKTFDDKHIRKLVTLHKRHNNVRK